MVRTNWPYHVTIDGRGYLLELDDQGRPRGAIYREDAREPWTQRWSIGPEGYSDMGPWGVQAWTDLSGGIGASEEDGSRRYWAGRSCDTRTGKALPGLLLGPTQNLDGVGSWDMPPRGQAFTSRSIDSTVNHVDGYAERFKWPSGWGNLGNVLLCVGVTRADLASATSLTVAVYPDVGGIPGGSAVCSEEVDLPAIQAWGAGSYAPLWVDFSPVGALSAGSYYWLTVKNPQGYTVWWASLGSAPTKLQAYWDGAMWRATTGAPLVWQAHPNGRLDGPPSFLIEFVTGTERRLTMGAEHKVFHWEPGDMTGAPLWVVVKGDFPQRVTDAVVFKEDLYVAQDNGGTIWSWDMSSWTNTDDVGQTLGIHDNMVWRAEGREVSGSTDGGDWGAGVDVGGAGAEVRALTSHGGKLYAATQDGLWEISYEATYPAVEAAIWCNRIVPYPWGQHNGRFLVDWHQGLYFPVSGSLWEWKNSNVRDIWRGRLDEEEPEIWFADRNLSRRFVVERGPGPWAGAADAGLHFTAAHGLERELLALRSPEASGAGTLGWLEVLAWDGHGWHPLLEWRNQGEMGRCLCRTADRWGPSGQLWVGALHDVLEGSVSTWYADRRYDPVASFTSSYEFVLPEFDAGTSTVRKDWQQVVIRHKGFDDGIPNTRIDLYYRTDPEPETAWTLGGTITRSAQEIIELSTAEVSKSIQLRVQVGCPMGQLPPGVPVWGGAPLVIEAVELWYQQMPPDQMQYQMVLRLGDKLALPSGVQDPCPLSEQVAHLRALNGTGDPFVFVDLFGDEHEVRRAGLSLTPARLRADAKTGSLVLEARAVLTLVDVEADVTLGGESVE